MSKIEKLELKHIAGYFPYGLKGVIKDKIVSLKSLHQNSLETSPSVHRFTYCSFPDFKPILRPLSDLTKEIEHEGKTFVPIVELAKLMKMLCPDKFLVFEDNKDGIDRIGCSWGNSTHEFWYDQKWRSFEYECISQLVFMNTSASYQLDMFEKLYEWHFNVHNLPEHLFIDINTIQQ